MKTLIINFIYKVARKYKYIYNPLFLGKHKNEYFTAENTE